MLQRRQKCPCNRHNGVSLWNREHGRLKGRAHLAHRSKDGDKAGM